MMVMMSEKWVFTFFQLKWAFLPLFFLLFPLIHSYYSASLTPSFFLINTSSFLHPLLPKRSFFMKLGRSIASLRSRFLLLYYFLHLDSIIFVREVIPLVGWYYYHRINFIVTTIKLNLRIVLTVLCYYFLIPFSSYHYQAQ